MEEGVSMVSVVMATYNGARYVGEQIESVLSQTYHDFELIICDDCSTDNTVDILYQYAEKDKRI
ncbi:MAG: glycosyltransferase, partial [Bacteroidaceae bacterium]|nr:glycosyltransferase [Bacteroidaceae bacterium]